MLFNAAAARPGGETSDEPWLGRPRRHGGSALTVDGRSRVYAPIRGPRDGEGPTRERRYHRMIRSHTPPFGPASLRARDPRRHAIAQPRFTTPHIGAPLLARASAVPMI